LRILRADLKPTNWIIGLIKAITGALVTCSSYCTKYNRIYLGPCLLWEPKWSIILIYSCIGLSKPLIRPSSSQDRLKKIGPLVLVTYERYKDE